MDHQENGAYNWRVLMSVVVKEEAKEDSDKISYWGKRFDKRLVTS